MASREPCLTLPPRRATLLAAGALLAAPAHSADPPRLRFAELYQGGGALGLAFSPRLKSLAGQIVAMRGFMAPPLRIEAEFFVLSREPLALCPFCASDADWPADIVVVLLDIPTLPVSFQQPIEAIGRLELGPAIDPDTGFVSQIRLANARFSLA